MIIKTVFMAMPLDVDLGANGMVKRVTMSGMGWPVEFSPERLTELAEHIKKEGAA